MTTVSSTDAKIFYKDIPEAKANELVSEPQHQSLGVYLSIPTYAAWKDIPSTFLAGDKDQSAIGPEMVNMMIAGARMVEPTAFDVVEHCCMVGFPERTAWAIMRAAGEEF